MFKSGAAPKFNILGSMGRIRGRSLFYTDPVKQFEVGEWQVHPSLNRLARGADEVRVEPKVMHVLEALADTPGEVVTREQLVARVWPGVFVTDDVLHRAIRELRRAFGDETANPAYVETIRKRGYRLIAPVRRGASLDAPAVAAPVAIAKPRAPGRFIAASITLAAVLGAVVYVLASRPSPADPAPSSVRFAAMTSGPLNETDPAISPDGTMLAFAIRPAGEVGPADIYITRGAGQTPERVIAHPADDRYPSWSADAATLAFIRIDGRSCDIMLITLLRQSSHLRQGYGGQAGGQALDDRRERRLAPCGNPEEPRVSWSRNGDWLVESFAPGPDPIRGWQIARVSAASGVRELLTLPNPGTLGDYSPSVSPDGTRIAFVRGINGATSDVHIVSMSGGPPTRVTWDNQDLVGLDWSADGKSILYATDRAGGYTIWRVDLDGGDPQLVVGGAAKLKHPSVARSTGRVTYESWAYEINLWEAPIVERLDLEGDLTPTLRPAVTTSDQWNHSPDLSPDESQLAFISTRSGGAEVWISNRDGSNARQLSRFGRASMRVPRWSPDGRQILISAAVNGQPDLYALEVASGKTTQLTFDQEDEVAPSWGHDGTSVHYGARRGGTWQIMRLGFADRSITQLTTDGGYAAQPSPDGRQIMFTRLERQGVWTMPVEGGAASLLVPSVRAAETANWRVTPHGIYYIGATADQPVVRRAPLTGGPGVDVAWIGNYSWPGLAVTRDGKVIYAHWDRRESNIMAMDP
jgi:Tol biopolymer transport system component/DNA-binding winged helix-turn-helix (wHTH) protein